MENKIAIIDSKIPIKAIPSEKLEKVILDEFSVWVSDLLSLSDETSARRLYNALPAIKEHCFSMGFDEIKKMFEMYADNKLSISPIPNYFDRILFGKIVSAYKQQKPVKKKEIKMPELSQEEKDNLTYIGVVNCFDEWKQTKRIINGYAWVEEHLRDKMNFTDEEKIQMWEKALTNLKDASKDMDYITAKNYLRDLETNSKPKRQVEYQLIRLDRYFTRLHAKGKHVKDVL